MIKRVDLTNREFGLLTVERSAEGQSKTGSPIWDCVCRCGAARKARSNQLVHGRVWACYRCTKTEAVPEDVRKVRESGTEAPLMTESEYIQDWRRYLESFTAAEHAEFLRIMKGRKNTTANKAEAVDVVKRERL